LGNESSVVNVSPDNPLLDLITGGAQRGQNLFHSFEQFNVTEGRGAYFTSPSADIVNILSRITGNNISEIFGTLGTNGASQPNLFLINPNGIVFGQNAALNVGGSFVATTADSIKFGDRGFFSVSNPEVPPLLTVQPSAFFFNQMNDGGIQNNSIAAAGLDPSGSFEVFGLRVPDGKSLSLLGGELTVNGGGMSAFGGVVNLGAVSGEGTVNLNLNGNNFSFDFPEIARANVSIINRSSLLTLGDGGGDIIITADKINVLNNSSVETGIGSNLGTETTQAGNIVFDATDAIAIDNSFIYNQVRTTSTGNSGDISIKSRNLAVTNGGKLGLLVFGRGDTGNLSIEATESFTLDSNATGLFTGIFSNLGASGDGNVGNIKITAGNLTISNNSFIDTRTFGLGNSGNIDIDTQNLVASDGAQITASTFGGGNAGSIDIKADNTVTFDGGIFNIRTGISSNIESGAVGQGGEIIISAKNINLTNGAQLQTLVRSSTNNLAGGVGNAGNIRINATEQTNIRGVGDGFPSGIFSEVGQGATGNAGNIDFQAKFLTVSEGALLTSNSFGEGNAGNISFDVAENIEFSGAGTRIRANVGSTAIDNIQGGDLTIDTKQLLVRDGAQVSVSIFGSGNAGNLKVFATESVELRGEEDNFPGGLFAQVDLTGTGKGGNLTITTPDLSIRDGSKVQVATFGQGDAGELLIKADAINIFNTSTFSDFTTGIFGSVEIDPKTVELPEGQGGNLTIETAQLSLRDGGKISVDTKGIGNAGNLQITASEFIEISGVDPDGDGVSIIGADVSEAATGQGGYISLNTRQLAIKDRGEISVTSLGNGEGGDINIKADEIALDNGLITGTTRTRNGGNINLQISDILLLDNQSQISTTAGTAEAGGNGGNIGIDAEFIVAFPNQNNDITANAFQGKGGDININAESIFGLEERPLNNLTNDINASSEFGLDGEISINTPDTDPLRGLDNLPNNFVDASTQMVSSCLTAEEEKSNKFILTGRGGIPSNPTESVQGDATLSAEWLTLPETTTQLSEAKTTIKTYQPTEIVEAKGWIIKPDGTVVLTAKANSADNLPWGFIPSGCQNIEH
jgi:filamentous hemagglutinin family protein